MKLVVTHSAFLFEIPIPGKQIWSPYNFFSENLEPDEIWGCGIPGKKIFIESDYYYLKYTFRWSLYK